MAADTKKFCKDHYKAVKLLGKGNDGRVYQLEKKPEYHDSEGPAILAKKICFDAEKEAELMLTMPSHENVLKCYDFVIGDTVDIYLECCDEDLKSYMEKNRISISEDQEKIVSLSKQMMAGLAHIHGRNVFHRDLKPANVLIKHTNYGPILKIADFGLSKSIKVDQTQAVTIAGTGRYMSPEMLEAFLRLQHRGEQVDIAPMPSDIYSMGLLLLILLTSETEIVAIREDKSKTCAIIQERFPDSPMTPALLKMLAEKPRDRATAYEIYVYFHKTLVSFNNLIISWNFIHL